MRRTNSTGRGNEPINENHGNVNISGLEFESSWLLTSNSSVILSFGLIDAEWITFVVDINNDGIVTDNTYLDVLMTPKLTGFSAVNYNVDLSGNLLEYQLDVRYQSRYNTFGESNDAIFYRPGTTLINGTPTWTWRQGQRGTSVSLFGRNPTDSKAPQQIIGASIFPVAVYEPPRLLGLELKLGL